MVESRGGSRIIKRYAYVLSRLYLAVGADWSLIERTRKWALVSIMRIVSWLPDCSF